MTRPWRSVRDPYGRRVLFDARAHLHLAAGDRAHLLERVELILATIAWPDLHEHDPFAGRERYYRNHVFEPQKWLRVVVDFNCKPAFVVTVVIQDNSPRLQRRRR